MIKMMKSIYKNSKILKFINDKTLIDSKILSYFINILTYFVIFEKNPNEFYKLTWLKGKEGKMYF